MSAVLASRFIDRTLCRPEADAVDIERAFVEQLGFEAKAGLRLWGDKATTRAIAA